MQTGEHIQTTNSEVFLLGAVLNLLANIDYPALLDYAIRAAIGGIIYFIFKIVADWISDKYFNSKKKNKKRNE